MTFLSKTAFYLTLSTFGIACGALAPLHRVQAAETIAQSTPSQTSPSQTTPKTKPATPSNTTKPAPATKPAGPSLNLTADQKQKIQSIMQNSASQVMAVLTPEQRTKLQQAAQSQQPPEAITASLNLTSDQKTKIQSIQAQEEQQIKAILTPEQIKILQNRTGPK